MRLPVCTLGVLVASLAASGATLERLSLEEMATRSTAIVRGRAGAGSPTLVGSTIYTRTRFQVLERWKGPERSEVDVLSPGGTMGLTSQHYPGVPRFQEGQELVLFLWTGPSGRTQVIGYTQGVFEVVRSSVDGEDQVQVVRRPGGETLLDPGTATPVADEPVTMSLRQLVSRVRVAMVRGGTK